METNIRTVFETIGHIKKSLQCSICLDLFIEPVSTSCNHQFCSFCIKKFIDEKKGKTHLIYCPLCKNPITKRGLTPNPKLKEIVHVIHKLNSAFCEDAGLPDSPYPIIKPAVNNLHYDSSQTPIKSVNHCKSEDGNKQRCSSVINTSLSSTNHLKENKTSSPQRIPCKETESNKCLSQKNDKLTTQRCNATSSQLNVDKSGDNSSGSITVDEENLSQHSTLSENSVSLLDNLFLQESTIELSDQDVDHSSIANHTKGQNSLQKEINTCSYEKISKKAESSYSENIKEKNNLCFNVEKNELSSTQIEVSQGEEIKREENYQLSEKRVSNSLEANAETIETVDQENAIIDCYETGVAFKVTPPLLNSASVNADELNLNNGLSNLSERIPASVETDTEKYRVIPLPCHNRYDSHDEIISPEFPKVMGIPLESEKGNDENINSGNLKQSLADSHQLCFDQSTQAIPNSSNLLQVHHESSASSFQERQKIGSSPSRENNRLNFQHSINNNHFYDNDVGVNEREEASITLSKIPIVKNFKNSENIHNHLSFEIESSNTKTSAVSSVGLVSREHNYLSMTTKEVNVGTKKFHCKDSVVSHVHSFDDSPIDKLKEKHHKENLGMTNKCPRMFEKMKMFDMTRGEVEVKHLENTSASLLSDKIIDKSGNQNRHIAVIRQQQEATCFTDSESDVIPPTPPSTKSVSRNKFSNQNTLNKSFGLKRSASECDQRSKRHRRMLKIRKLDKSPNIKKLGRKFVQSNQHNDLTCLTPLPSGNVLSFDNNHEGLKYNGECLEDKNECLVDNYECFEGNHRCLEDNDECRENNNEYMEENDECWENNDECLEDNDVCLEDNNGFLEDNDECLEDNDKCLEDNDKCLEDNDECLEDNDKCLEDNDECLEDNDERLMENGKCWDENDECLDDNDECSEDYDECLEDNNKRDIPEGSQKQAFKKSAIDMKRCSLDYNQRRLSIDMGANDTVDYREVVMDEVNELFVNEDSNQEHVKTRFFSSEESQDNLNVYNDRSSIKSQYERMKENGLTKCFKPDNDEFDGGRDTKKLDNGRSSINDDDEMYSSQEDSNAVILRKLGFVDHKQSETESDGEMSDSKDADTTSVSSLTDGDGIEVSSQRIKYLYDVLAKTGGEIAKLTTDLRKLKENRENKNSIHNKNFTDIEQDTFMDYDVGNNKQSGFRGDDEIDDLHFDDELVCVKEFENNVISYLETDKGMYVEKSKSVIDSNMKVDMEKGKIQSFLVKNINENEMVEKTKSNIDCKNNRKSVVNCMDNEVRKTEDPKPIIDCNGDEEVDFEMTEQLTRRIAKDETTEKFIIDYKTDDYLDMKKTNPIIDINEDVETKKSEPIIDYNNDKGMFIEKDNPIINYNVNKSCLYSHEIDEENNDKCEKNITSGIEQTRWNESHIDEYFERNENNFPPVVSTEESDEEEEIRNRRSQNSYLYLDRRRVVTRCGKNKSDHSIMGGISCKKSKKKILKLSKSRVGETSMLNLNDNEFESNHKLSSNNQAVSKYSNSISCGAKNEKRIFIDNDDELEKKKKILSKKGECVDGGETEVAQDENDAIHASCPISPPPAIDSSRLKLTRLPPSVKNLKKMLEMDVNDEYEKPKRDKSVCVRSNFSEIFSEVRDRVLKDYCIEDSYLMGPTPNILNTQVIKHKFDESISIDDETSQWSHVLKSHLPSQRGLSHKPALTRGVSTTSLLVNNTGIHGINGTICHKVIDSSSKSSDDIKKQCMPTSFDKVETQDELLDQSMSKCDIRSTKRKDKQRSILSLRHIDSGVDGSVGKQIENDFDQTKETRQLSQKSDQTNRSVDKRLSNGWISKIALSKKQMLSSTFVQVNESTPNDNTSSYRLVLTRLSKEYVALVRKLVTKCGVKLMDDVTEETTHIVMPTDSQMKASRNDYSIKYLLGVSLGRWIVSHHWLIACAKSCRLVDEQRYEVKGDAQAAQSHVPKLARRTRQNKNPLLFDGISIVCVGKYKKAITTAQVCQLVRYSGGEAVDGNTLSISLPFISETVVICDASPSEEAVSQVKELCVKYKTFPVNVEWITDSVVNYQLQDIEEYRVHI